MHFHIIWMLQQRYALRCLFCGQTHAASPERVYGSLPLTHVPRILLSRKCMACGQVAQSPFHCLDEFDVFMDAVARRVSHRPPAC